MLDKSKASITLLSRGGWGEGWGEGWIGCWGGGGGGGGGCVGVVELIDGGDVFGLTLSSSFSSLGGGGISLFCGLSDTGLSDNIASFPGVWVEVVGLCIGVGDFFGEGEILGIGEVSSFGEVLVAGRVIGEDLGKGVVFWLTLSAGLGVGGGEQ